MQLPVTVLNANTKREQGRKAQLANIMAAKVPFLLGWEREGRGGQGRELSLCVYVCAPPGTLTPACLLTPATSGCRGHHPDHTGSQIHAQDVARPQWR
eukprot:1158344-Pelagomonas_calceolata.AAC.14